jgi:hypothetical protein
MRSSLMNIYGYLKYSTPWKAELFHVPPNANWHGHDIRRGTSMVPIQQVFEGRGCASMEKDSYCGIS